MQQRYVAKTVEPKKFVLRQPLLRHRARKTLDREARGGGSTYLEGFAATDHGLFFLSLPHRGRVGTRSVPGWGLKPRQFIANGLQYAHEVSIDLIIPKSKHNKPLANKVPVALTIFLGMDVQIMLAAINFDNQPMPQTREINYAPISR
jgi:hypothetical protein